MAQLENVSKLQLNEVPVKNETADFDRPYKACKGGKRRGEEGD
jgi:hypothetical protein